MAIAGGGDVEVKKARNLAGASGGEKVELRLQSRTPVSGALLLYLLPLLMMALVIAAAVEIGPEVGLDISPNVFVLIAAVIGLPGSVPLVRLINRKVKSLQNTVPDVTRIL
jgi:positive regulator of sigma E activity